MVSLSYDPTDQAHSRACDHYLAPRRLTQDLDLIHPGCRLTLDTTTPSAGRLGSLIVWAGVNRSRGAVVRRTPILLASAATTA